MIDLESMWSVRGSVFGSHQNFEAGIVTAKRRMRVLIMTLAGASKIRVVGISSFILILLTVGALLADTENVEGNTNVCGGIFADTTWDLAGSPYVVTCDVVLSPGFTLTVDPGVTVQFDTNTGLEIRGTLVAFGTSTDHIIFTSSPGGPRHRIGTGSILPQTRAARPT